jgi:hypothetical protein
MSKIEVNAIEPQSGTTLTLGASGDTITIPSGATINNQGSAVNFGPTGAVSWDVANIKTTGFTAVSGFGYFCNTTSAAFTVTLPASPSAGNVVAISDYAATFATNNITVNPNGNKIAGSTQDKLLITNGIAVTFVYVDSTEGWLVTDSGLQSDFKSLPYSMDFLVIAGGGGGGNTVGGGGGAGGYRTSTQTVAVGTTITVTVGDGGSSSSGSDSSISGTGLSTITSAGGGVGGNYPGNNGANGGSGGGGGGNNTAPVGSGGSGNTPSTSPSQGNNGGAASAAGISAAGGARGSGGDGTASSITGSSVTRAGGGGGGAADNTVNGLGGSGGGGAGGYNSPSGTSGVAGTVNTGGGGGGARDYGSGSGGKGVVILSMPDANYTGTTQGSPTVATGVSGKTVLTFTGSGSYTA